MSSFSARMVLGTAAIVAALFLSSPGLTQTPPAPAAKSALKPASACTGLSQNVCSTKPECGWRKAYKRKDGTEVAAACRKKPLNVCKGLDKTQCAAKAPDCKWREAVVSKKKDGKEKPARCIRTVKKDNKKDADKKPAATPK